MDRKEKVFVVKNISHLKENLMFLSKSKENVILLDSNNKKNDFAIIGEPTKMEIAIAEKGLIVFDLIITLTR